MHMYLYMYAVCNLSCGAGYIVLTDCSKCIFINTCEADTPCEINEVCILGSQPDEYTCTVLATNCSGRSEIITLHNIYIHVHYRFCKRAIK